MTKKQLGGLLTIIVAQILNLIIERRNVSHHEAVRLLYTSALYSKLEDEKTKLWHLSSETFRQAALFAF